MSTRLLAACVTVGLGLSGCSHSSLPVLPPGDCVPQTGIRHVLHNLQMAFRNLDAERYAALFDDDFLHGHDRRDVGPDRPWSEESWDKETEVALFRCLSDGEPDIRGEIISACRISFSVGEPEPSTLGPSWIMVILGPLELIVVTTEVASGDDWLSMSPLHPWVLHLVRTEEQDPATGERIWRIIRREEIVTDRTISWASFRDDICRP